MGRTKRQKEQEKREKRNQLIIGVIIAALFVFSSFGFIMNFAGGGQQQNVQIYEQDQQLFARLDGQNIQVYSYPDTGIYVPTEVPSLLQNSEMIVVLFDPTQEQNLIYTDVIRFDFAEYFDAQAGAIVTEQSQDYPYPVASCEVASTTSPVIKIMNGTPEISINGSCITMSGEEEQLLYLRDQLIYSYYGAR